MLGGLRFVLAMAVVFSHTGLTPDFHFGSMAVVVFFMIAGYVMTYSFRVNFSNDMSNILRFYRDRFFRIYPLYALSLVIIAGFCVSVGYGKLYLDPWSMFANLTIFPLNIHSNILNPPAWSLGSEVQFYTLLPFLVRFPKFKYLLLPFSYAIFALATFEKINPLRWGYKLLPGTLFVFILGSIICDMRTDVTRRSRNIVGLVVGVVTVHLAALSFFDKPISQPYAFESLIGLIVGTGCLLVLGEAKLKDRRLDNLLGKMSYPIFLSHVAVLYFFDYLHERGYLLLTSRGLVAVELTVSIVASVPLMLLDDRFQIHRKRVQVRSVSRREAATESPAITAERIA